MSYHAFYKQLNELALETFPGLKDIETPAWEYLVSPLVLELPKSILLSVENSVKSLYALSRRDSYRSRLSTIPGIDPKPNHSVLMAYDYHTNEAGEAFLVEVNTNAAGYLFTSLMEMAHEGPNSFAELKRSFENEMRLSGKSGDIAIVDENIPEQKMFPEFVMYRDWFRQQGWTAEFMEAAEFAPGPQFVYNRLTDFYLENYPALREAFISGSACFSPNPYEYFLLCDKERLIQFGNAQFLKDAGARDEEVAAITKVVIPTFDKSHFGSVDDIWQDRKQLFFKPKRSHGGKSVYRGESVSRKVFERLMMEDILIQRYQPAQKVPTDDPRSVLENWKFDLRFFVYEDKIQFSCARIYQGQVTNFSSQYGGFTKIRFV